jgi:ubiquinone biosynthesis protein Coq4
MKTTLIQKMKLLSAFWKVVKNPLDVSAFNEITDRYVDTSLFADVFSRLNNDPASRLALEKRTQMKAIPPEAFNFYAKGSLGLAYKDYMVKHKIVVQKPGFDPSNPISYLRYRYRHYNHIWRIILGYDISPEGQAGLHAFLYVQTNSPISMMYLALSLMHGVLFKRGELRNIFERMMDGWHKGKTYRLLWGVPLEHHFRENLEALRSRYQGVSQAETPPPLRLAQ